MARVLVVYHRHPRGQWRSTYQSHLTSFRRFSSHDCFYLNTARTKVPKYLRSLEPDLIIFHYTFLALRLAPEEFETHARRVSFLKDLSCPKAIIPHDEQIHAGLLCSLVRDFGVTHIFTPASAATSRQIYEGTDLDSITFRTVLTGYVDEEVVSKYAKRAERRHGRPIDVGYRSWSFQPSYGRHGLLKGEVGDAVKERAGTFGLVADISSDYRDAFLGDSWFEFLLRCKYTLGVEGGTSILDHDGTITERSRRYMAEHPDATFEEVEAACFPGVDGHFDYFLLGPRHFEAVITRTCQVLIEGTYGGALQAGRHYISLKRDFSNLDDVLGLMKADELRAQMVDRAYEDVIASGKWTYRAFANLVLREMLSGIEPSRLSREIPHMHRLVWWNRVEDPVWRRTQALPIHPRSLRESTRDGVVLLVGEERLWRLLVRAHNVLRRLRGRPPLSLEYMPTDAELARRKRKAEKKRTAGKS